MNARKLIKYDAVNYLCKVRVIKCFKEFPIYFSQFNAFIYLNYICPLPSGKIP